jgi:small subunit ribosomal protein S4
VPRVHRLEHVEGLAAANLADDDPVGAHAEGVPHEVALGDGALPLDVRGAGFQPDGGVLLENQFRAYFQKAERMKGVTGENLLVLLERRLDSMIYRMGFATSRTEARQLVRHSHFTVNGRKVNIPSYLVRPGDVVELRDKSRKVARINEALDGVMRRGLPSWVDVDRPAFKGTVKTLPVRAEMTTPTFQEQLIVELYSK